MAMASAEQKDEKSCSICQNIYTDSLNLTCKHFVCLVCIGNVLDTQDGFGGYECPVCRAEFQNHPVPSKKRKICNIVESLLGTQPEQNETVILCNYCMKSQVPAAKTCLLCEASLCEDHLEVHSKSVEHILTEPTTSFENRKCSVHKEILKYYCLEDAVCVCVSCRLDGDHKGHQVESLNEASKKKKENLRRILQTLTSKRTELEKRVQGLQTGKKVVEKKSVGVLRQAIFLISYIKTHVKEMEKQVVSELAKQKKQISLPYSVLIHQLDIRSNNLSKKITHLEELCNMMDPLTVLQELQSDCADYCDAQEGNSKGIDRNDKEVHVTEDMDMGVISVMVHTRLNELVTGVKQNIQMDVSEVLLDVNTAGNHITVSGDLKTVSWSEVNQSHQESPKRFQNNQILSITRYSSGQHYCQVETSETNGWKIGMAYPSIDRKGDQSKIGYNKKSWSLGIWNNRYSVIHNGKVERLCHGPSCQRLGIYLHYKAGCLSFYELCNPIKHLYTFTTTFTEPLHVAFWLWKNTWLRSKN
ncbi:E3 ubiquitin ISG15 ligase TRIM25-like [Pelobates cultripes]|uniref:E3 ubiquitin ISG15 ligase TRIM25-like n=1 Tax=Pelobates cultripes TaxID=61616 RepID=A0AAD1T8A0_PELCU|nr:E3 ubiquitin ISG15 ligase TRIM25-like [Pelobates cultripes]